MDCRLSRDILETWKLTRKSPSTFRPTKHITVLILHIATVERDREKNDRPFDELFLGGNYQNFGVTSANPQTRTNGNDPPREDLKSEYGPMSRWERETSRTRPWNGVGAFNRASIACCASNGRTYTDRDIFRPTCGSSGGKGST